MKTEEEFLKDIYEKADVLRAKEASEAIRRKKLRKLTAGISAAAACLILVVGVSGVSNLFAASDAVLYNETAVGYENAGGASELLQMKDGQTDDSTNAASADTAAADMEKESVYDGSSDSTTAEPSNSAGKNAAKSAGNSGGMTAANSQSGGSDDSSTALEKGRSAKEDKANNDESADEAYDGVGDSNDDSDKIGEGGNNDLVASYYCLPARIIIEDTDGNAEAAIGAAITAVFNEVIKLESEGKAVSAKLAEPVPVESYVKRIIYVTNGTETASGEAVRLDDEHPNNIVWYITE